MEDDDEIIEVNNIKFSLRKILEEKGWAIYCQASEKVKALARLQVRMDLSAMEIGFARLDKLMGKDNGTKIRRCKQ